MTRVRIGLDVDRMTTDRLAGVLDALQRAYEVELAAEAESRRLLDRPVAWAAREAAKALGVSPELSIEHIQMTSSLSMRVAVPGGGCGFIALLHVIREKTAMRERKQIENDMLRVQVETFRTAHGLSTHARDVERTQGHLDQASLPPILNVVRGDEPESPDVNDPELIFGL